MTISRRQLLRHTGVAFREDRSNSRNEPTRNRIRNNVLPLIEAEVNPQVRDALVRLGEQASWVADYLGETVQRTFESLIISRTDQQVVLNADTLVRKSRIVQAELVRLAYRSFGLGEQDLAFEWLQRAYDQRSTELAWLRVRPVFDSLRNESRFAELLTRIGLV